MGNLAPRSVFTNSEAGTGQNPNTGPGLSTLQLNQGAIRELPGALPPQDVIIHDGAISGFESAALIVDTEGEAAADELNVINIVLSANENLHPGMIITLRAKDQARTVTVKNSAAANGINTAGGHDVVLSTEWDLVLRLVAGRWYEIQTRGDVRASDAQTDASTALARTAPATTTSRGICRVATLADMEPGAVVENGPAVIDATGGVITTTPTAHAVPQADANGKLDGWVSPDANKANKDLSNLSASAGEVIRQNASLRALGTRETPGTWTLTGVKPGRALIIGARDTSGSTNAYCMFNVLSGSDIGQSPTAGGYFMLGRTNAYISSCSATLKPTSNTVIIRVHLIADMVAYAEQI